MRRFTWILVAALGLGTAVERAAIAQPDRQHDRDRGWDRDRGRDHGRDHRRLDRPDRAPPPPRKEFARPRKGRVWIPGAYQWRDGQWMWTSGYYVRRIHGKRWSPGHWDLSRGEWLWTPGAWIEVSVRPLTAPPPPMIESHRMQRGQIWIPGHYQWVDGEWVWQPGYAMWPRL